MSSFPEIALRSRWKAEGRRRSNDGVCREGASAPSGFRAAGPKTGSRHPHRVRSPVTALQANWPTTQEPTAEHQGFALGVPFMSI